MSVFAKRLIGVLFAACAVVLFIAPAAGAAESGVVEVKGTTFSTVVKVDLQRDLGDPTVAIPEQPGTKGWPIRKILLFAQDATRKFVLNSLEKDPELSRQGKGDISVSRFQVADKAYDAKLPVYFVDEEGATTLRERSGTLSSFTNLNPQISVSKSITTLGVTITQPKPSVRIKAGESLTFKAKVNNPGGAAVKLTWSVDGTSRQSGTSATNGTFTYEFPKEGTFSVQVFASATGAATNADSVTVTVGKAAKKKAKKKEPQEDPPAENTTDPYGFGYGDPYGGDPYGGDPGPGYPSAAVPPSSNPQPQQPQQEEPQPPVDDGLETVTGQLVDPNQIATAVPSTETPTSPGETESVEPAESKSGWGGLSDGALTAIGVGALLGLGGLTEAGAFAGLRRFRLRP